MWAFRTACTAACAFSSAPKSKHALAYLRLLENPNDDTSFMRVVNFPARALARAASEQLQDLAKATGCSLHDAVSTLTGRPGAVIGFVASVTREADLNLKDIIKLMLEHSGLLEHYRKEREGEDRIGELGRTGERGRKLCGVTKRVLAAKRRV